MTRTRILAILISAVILGVITILSASTTPSPAYQSLNRVPITQSKGSK